MWEMIFTLAGFLLLIVAVALIVSHYTGRTP
jgi:hypothetical protein